MLSETALASARQFTAQLRMAVRNTIFGPGMLEGLARVGHATHGLVYLFIGMLAIASAFNETRPPSLAGAFFIIDHLPGGWIVLLTVAFGLCAFGGWRLMQSLLDLKRCGWAAKGLVRRSGLLLESCLYASLGMLAAVISLSRDTGLSREIKEEATFAVAWTERILDWPLGHWIVGAVGLGAIGIGGIQFVRARGDTFDSICAGERAMVAIRLVGWIGLAARGAIFAATGILFLIAAWRTEASDVGGTRAALAALAGVPLGDWALFTVSAGLAVYGILGLVKAWFHKQVTP